MGESLFVSVYVFMWVVCVCLSVCGRGDHVYFSVCLVGFRVHVCLSVCLCVCGGEGEAMSVFVWVCLCMVEGVCLSVCREQCLFVGICRVPFCLYVGGRGGSLCLSVCMGGYLSVWVSVCLNV